jgi:hypothetical protein
MRGIPGLVRGVIAASALFALPAAAAVNLIADGGFEQNAVETNGYVHYARSLSVDGGHWFVMGDDDQDDILKVDRGYGLGDPRMTFVAHGGHDSLDLTGTGNQHAFNGVYQDVATVAGKAYHLTFWTGRATGVGTTATDYLTAATTNLSIDGAPVASFVNTDTVIGGLAWVAYSYDFVATGATTRIAFINNGGNDYLGLDDVSLASAVPEPATWAMMMVGLALTGGVGARLRRVRSSRTVR